MFIFELKINDSSVPDTVPVVVKEESSPQSTFYKDIAGFSLGIAASLLIAVGTGCIQVRQNGAWGTGEIVKQLQLHKLPQKSHAMERTPCSPCNMNYTLLYIDTPETFSALFTPLFIYEDLPTNFSKFTSDHPPPSLRATMPNSNIYIFF